MNRVRIIITTALVLISISALFYYYLKGSEKIEILSNDNSSKELDDVEIKEVFISLNKVKESNSIDKIFTKEATVAEDSSIDDTKDEKKSMKNLFSTYSLNSNYLIELLMENKIESYNNSTKFISISGTLEDENNSTKFSISVNEEYIYDTSNLALSVKNLESNETLYCDGYFLNNISRDFTYFMSIKIGSSSIDCEIISQHSSSINLSTKFKDSIQIDDKKLLELNSSILEGKKWLEKL